MKRLALCCSLALCACGPDPWTGAYAGTETVTADDASGAMASGTLAATWSIARDGGGYTVTIDGAPACVLGAGTSGEQLALAVGAVCTFGDAAHPTVFTLVSGAVSHTASGVRLGTLWTVQGGTAATITIDSAGP